MVKHSATPQPRTMLEAILWEQAIEQRALAAKVGMTEAMVSRLVSGMTQMRADHAERLAPFLRVPVIVLLMPYAEAAA